MAKNDLFPSTLEPGSARAPVTGYVATNHLNLMYMLAAGLVMPPAGFGDKYYRDTLECFPGWIPLFIGKVPLDAIQSSTLEAAHLKPILVEIGLSRMSGQVMVVGEDGLEERCFPEQLDGTERLILVPAPLPASWIECIVFQSADDRRACERDAQDFGNVPLSQFERRTGRALFTRALKTPWPPSEGPAERSVELERPLAVGGVMAMLFFFGNLGEGAVRACGRAFDPAADLPHSSDDHPILAGLGTWVREGVAPLPAPGASDGDRVGLQNVFQARLFWDAIERLVDWRDAGGVGSPETLLLDLLAEATTSLDPRVQAGAKRLRNTLESLMGLGDATASEIFERHDTSFAHAMTLFFLRGDCVDLIDYRSDRLAESDWLAAAILFGVRDGWLRLPLRLRSLPELSSAVSHRMSTVSHRIAGTGLDLGEPPARVRPLRELFGDGSSWGSGERLAALELAREQRWDCVHTCIRLGVGEYRLMVKGGSTYIEVPGEPRLLPEVDMDRFFDLLAGARVDHETEKKVRRKIRG